MKKEWGFLRETSEKAKKDGIDKDTGICRTGLNEYLEVIFPEINDWIHDKEIGVLPDGKKSKRRPDYRSEKLKMIVEFDGLQHYTDPEQIKKDLDSVKFYENYGYKIVRIPYFIQLSNEAVKELFGVEVNQMLFDDNYPSMGLKGKNTPGYLCMSGLKRMASEFKRFPKQYSVNKDALEKFNDEDITGIKTLEEIMNQL